MNKITKMEPIIWKGGKSLTLMFDTECDFGEREHRVRIKAHCCKPPFMVLIEYKGRKGWIDLPESIYYNLQDNSKVLDLGLAAASGDYSPKIKPSSIIKFIMEDKGIVLFSADKEIARFYAAMRAQGFQLKSSKAIGTTSCRNLFWAGSKFQVAKLRAAMKASGFKSQGRGLFPSTNLDDGMNYYIEKQFIRAVIIPDDHYIEFSGF